MNETPDAEAEPVLVQARREGVFMTRTRWPAALTAQQIAGAGLDVWEDEPPPPDHPLLRFDNVVVSPHTAGITRQSRHHIAKIAAEQILDIFDGKKPPRLLNPEVWGTYSERFTRILGFRPEG